MQLPPPVHGMTVMSDRVARSEHLRARFDLEVLPLRFASSLEDIGGVSLRKLARAATTAVRLVGALSLRRPDAVYFTFTPVGVAYYRDCLYVAIIRALGVQRVYHLHAKGIEPRVASRWGRALAAWAFEGARVIQMSPYLKHDVASVVSDEQLAFVPNGIPLVTPSPEHHVHDGPPRILFLSNMSRAKGPLLLLDALDILAKQRVAFTATFAGAAGNDGCVDEFNARLDSSGLRDHVKYVGPVYGKDKVRLFTEADVFAFPTYQDAFPLVILEAMQFSVPVVSTIEGAIPEMLEDGVTGYLVAKGDARALASRIGELLVEPARRRTLGGNARTRFLSLYTDELFEHNLGDALMASIGEAPSSSRETR